MFAVTVVVGLIIHCFIILPSLYFFVLRSNPYKYYGGFTQAIFTALGTDSSAATLPVTLKCIKQMGKRCVVKSRDVIIAYSYAVVDCCKGISDKIAQIVLPLGVTLNMNGTALYVGYFAFGLSLLDYY